ncbi:MAG: short-chain-enoyl-CoA hydratase [Eubacterium sp.]|nr:short-chain-enoyl-CoA hydratase [Eubacterium sp.]MCD8239111.1 short-chain-enoyl-CoA hydratase [Clostridiales bacterium]
MSNVLSEVKGNVAVLTINKPQALNALNDEVLSDLSQAFTEAENNKDVYVIIITGAGKAFVAGADISQMKDFGAVEGKAFGVYGNSVFMAIENSPKPVIAAINGFALGGGNELALSCDMRIASSKAKFGQPEVGLGITPGFGGTQRLPRTVGKAKAMELILTGKTIKADEALSIGLVNKVVEPEALMDEAMALAEAICANAQIAVRQSKACINRGLQTDIATGVSFEAEAFGLCFATEDQKEGMTAFVEKREKNFKNC